MAGDGLLESDVSIEQVKRPEILKEGPEDSTELSSFTAITPIVEIYHAEKDEAALEDVRRRLEGVMEDPKESRLRAEVEIVKADPENVGMVIDHEFIINPWRVDIDQRVQLAKGIQGVSDSELEILRQDPGVVAQVENDQAAERQKVDTLREYLDRFEGKLEHVRVHPPGEVSPLSLGAAVRYIDGNRTISLPPEYVEQIKMIQDKAKDVTLVLQFFDPKNGPDNASPVPTGQSVDDFIALCQHVVETFGPEVSLEFGVEPNVSRDTDPKFKQSLQYLPGAEDIDPQEYGDFYAHVADAVKKGTPGLKCIPAGLAFYDRRFTEEMLKSVISYEESHGIQRGSLIDVLSIHPYRDGDASEACADIEDGKFLAITYESFEAQFAAFREVALSYSPATELRLGEFNFQNHDPDWEKKLKESIALSSKSGTPTYIYPGFKPWH